jgi:nucleoside-diphosphate-sugar epimerase
VTVRAVVEKLVSIIGSPVAPRFEARLDRPLEKACVAEVAPTAAALGWSPRTPLEEGLAKTVTWYREHGSRERQTERS